MRSKVLWQGATRSGGQQYRLVEVEDADAVEGFDLVFERCDYDAMGGERWARTATTRGDEYVFSALMRALRMRCIGPTT